MTILVVAEHDNKALRNATLNAVTAAIAIGGEIHILVAGHGCRAVAEAAAAVPGIAKVLLADDPAYEHLLAEDLAALIVPLVKGYGHILAAADPFGKNFMPRVAALLDVAQISDISAVVSPDTFVRPIYAGNALATVQSHDPVKVFAQGKTMLWQRAGLERAGGIEALAKEVAEDAASTKIVRGAGLKVRLVDRPFVQPLGYRSAAEVWRRQLRWARLRRASFLAYFLPEAISGGVLPMVTLAGVAVALDLPPTLSVAGLGAVWYGSEMLLAAAAGWHLSARYPLCCLARDLLLPVLFVKAMHGDDFVWRGNEIRPAPPSP